VGLLVVMIVSFLLLVPALHWALDCMRQVILALALIVMGATSLHAQTSYTATGVRMNGDPQAAVFSFTNDPTPGVQVQIACGTRLVWWYYTGVGTQDYHAYGPFPLSSCTVSYSRNSSGALVTTVSVPMQTPEALSTGGTVTLEPSTFSSTNDGRFHTLDNPNGSSQISVE
jgi:hypothetical protein